MTGLDTTFRAYKQTKYSKQRISVFSSCLLFCSNTLRTQFDASRRGSNCGTRIEVEMKERDVFVCVIRTKPVFPPIDTPHTQCPC